MLKSNTRGTELLEISWFNQIEVCTLYVPYSTAAKQHLNASKHKPSSSKDNNPFKFTPIFAHSSLRFVQDVTRMPSTTNNQFHSGLQSETGIRWGMNTVTLQPPVKFALPWGGVQTVHRNKQPLQITFQNERHLFETKHTELWGFSW
jgi:hypothetical protein